MKVKELVEMMKKSNISALKPEQLKSKLIKDLQVKHYISIKEKRELISRIINECIIYENGIYKIDDITKYIMLVMLSIETYTNIELSDDVEQDYDILCEAGMLGRIINTFDEEYQSISAFLQMQCDYILADNSIEAKIGVFLDGCIDKITTLENTLSHKVENFSLDKLNITQEDMQKISSFLEMMK